MILGGQKRREESGQIREELCSSYLDRVDLSILVKSSSANLSLILPLLLTLLSLAGEKSVVLVPRPSSDGERDEREREARCE